jgi:STE24 endopeptidase
LETTGTILAIASIVRTGELALKFSFRFCQQQRMRCLLLFVLTVAFGFSGLVGRAYASPAQAAAVIAHPPLGTIPAGAEFDASGHLDTDRATRAYLDTIPFDKRLASNKYFEGGYWFLLWDALYSIAIMLFLLYSGISVKMRNLSAARTPRLWLQTAIYAVGFILILTLLGAPINWYENFYREHLYQQTQQSLGNWIKDQSISLAVILVIGPFIITLLYSVARRLPKTWYIWGPVVVCIFSAVIALIAPVYIAPLFNTYSRIQDPAVVDPILKMARANGIPVDALYQVDASRQSTRVSANVSGILNTTRITLNDNLLSTCSIQEIEETTGHEMGHYVLNHIYKSLVEFAVIFFVVFAVLRLWLESMQRRHAARWHTTSIFDPALLPGVYLIMTVIFLLLTPVTNTLTRTQEREADIFGLNAARQPDASAQVDLKLGQYRKLDPTPLEEFIFFDHPSGHTRILDAMNWKSQNKGVPGYQ